MALEHNQKIKIAQENAGMATDLRKAAMTQFLPDFGFNGGYMYTNKKLNLMSENGFLPVVPYTAISSDGTLDITKLTANDIVINPSTGKPVLDKNGNPVFQKYSYMPKESMSLDLRNIYTFGFAVTQPIFTGGKIVNLYKSSKYLEKIARSNQAMETSDLLYKVDENYWKVISVQEKIKVADEYKKMLDKLLFDLENLEKEGFIITNDLLKARVKQNEVELMQFKAGNGLVLSKMALCQVIGLPLDSNVVLDDSIVPSSLSASNTDITAKALSDRPEISILENNVNLANAGVNIMKSRFLPDIGMTAGYGWMNPSPYDGFSKEFGGAWTVGVVAKVPLWHWGERYRTLNSAEHQKKISELKLDETKELITLQARQAKFQYDESGKKLELTNRSLQQAIDNLRVTNDKFSEGMLKSGDVLEAQAAWQKAYSEEIDAKIEIKINETNLKKVSGELSKENK
jgi:outer membrane protein TolC